MITIVVRSSPDYNKLNEKTFGFQLNQPYKPHTEIRKMIEGNVLQVWRKFFAIDFFEYRHEMAQIAQDNLKNTECRIVRSFEFNLWLRENEESVVIPVDDDDWFSPDIKDIVLDEQIKVMCWNKSTYKNFNSTKFYENEGFRLGYNNWCVRKSWLQSLPLEDARKLILGSHRHSEVYVKDNLPSNCLKVINDKLSVHLRHIGSLAMLRSLADDGKLIQMMEEISTRIPSATQAPEYFRWTEKYIKMSESLSAKMRRKLIC